MTAFDGLLKLLSQVPSNDIFDFFWQEYHRLLYLNNFYKSGMPRKKPAKSVISENEYRSGFTGQTGFCRACGIPVTLNYLLDQIQ